MYPRPLNLLISLCALLLALANATGALACACCTNEGQRRVEAAALEPGKRAELMEVRFAPTARLFVGEGDAEGIAGITLASEAYDLAVTWHEDRLVLSFRDSASRSATQMEARSGTLTLPIPDTVSIFEVDPRDGPDRGMGPSLYKEWTLSGTPKGTGIFTPGLGPDQRLSLVLQGRGNSCTTPSVDFSHWTLVMRGPKASYTFFGNLVGAPWIGLRARLRHAISGPIQSVTFQPIQTVRGFVHRSTTGRR